MILASARRVYQFAAAGRRIARPIPEKKRSSRELENHGIETITSD
jgi:hypothetical protein